jgi:hypothetical protein
MNTILRKKLLEYLYSLSPSQNLEAYSASQRIARGVTLLEDNKMDWMSAVFSWSVLVNDTPLGLELIRMNRTATKQKKSDVKTYLIPGIKKGKEGRYGINFFNIAGQAGLYGDDWPLLRYYWLHAALFMEKNLKKK